MAYTNVPFGWKKVKVTATGNVTQIGPGNVFGGILMSVAGTTSTVTVYDDTTAAAGNLFIATTAALTAGQYVSPTGGVVAVTGSGPADEGITLTTGLYITVGGSGSPTFWVLYK